MVELNSNETNYWNYDVNYLPEETKRNLMDRGILINSNIDEFSTYRDSIFSNIKDPSNDYYKIMTTTECNARCQYCFEKNFRKVSMNNDTADTLIEYISKISDGKKRIDLGWFGGEPLVNHKIISYIVDKLKKTNKFDKIDSTMITNGSLFSEELVKEACTHWNLSKVQITLDGTEENHNKIKNYTNQKYNYACTLNNIQLLVNAGIKVTVRINYTSSNVSDVLELMDELYLRFKKSIRIYASPVIIPTPSSPSLVNYESDKKVLGKMIELGYVKPEWVLRIRRSPCGLSTHKNNVVISPTGGIYKCAETMNHENITKIGDVKSQNRDEKLIKLWQSNNVKEECTMCRYYPLCLGGCRATQLGLTNVDCFRFKSQVENAILYIYFKKKGLNINPFVN